MQLIKVLFSQYNNDNYWAKNTGLQTKHKISIQLNKHNNHIKHYICKQYQPPNHLTHRAKNQQTKNINQEDIFFNQYTLLKIKQLEKQKKGELHKQLQKKNQLFQKGVKINNICRL
eukprot:TRINITY_DN19095_c0_g1_i1.p4 TRINITY_DN19095_c0_g1~~TRINITY_DN19095_c0_g1_i1.p4  ORF type:complete len:116 (-),score=0.78 TRINITY_DN19095_c0_g1_i1:39-386(-)